MCVLGRDRENALKFQTPDLRFRLAGAVQYTWSAGEIIIYSFRFCLLKYLFGKPLHYYYYS